MADNGHGGSRPPSTPAAVSGPGKLSQRTDVPKGQKLMGMTGLAYGEAGAINAQEHAAPMAAAPAMPTGTVTRDQIQADASQGPSNPFNAPSARPDEPVTHGVNIGPGAGPEVLPQLAQPALNPQGPMSSMIQSLAPGQITGDLADLYQAALASGV